MLPQTGATVLAGAAIFVETVTTERTTVPRVVPVPRRHSRFRSVPRCALDGFRYGFRLSLPREGSFHGKVLFPL